MTAPNCPAPYCEARVQSLDDEVRQLLIREAAQREKIDSMDANITKLLAGQQSIVLMLEREKGQRAAAEWIIRVLWAVAIAAAGVIGFKVGGRDG